MANMSTSWPSFPNDHVLSDTSWDSLYSVLAMKGSTPAGDMDFYNSRPCGATASPSSSTTDVTAMSEFSASWRSVAGEFSALSDFSSSLRSMVSLSEGPESAAHLPLVSPFQQWRSQQCSEPWNFAQADASQQMSVTWPPLAAGSHSHFEIERQHLPLAPQAKWHPDPAAATAKTPAAAARPGTLATAGPSSGMSMSGFSTNLKASYRSSVCAPGMEADGGIHKKAKNVEAGSRQCSHPVPPPPRIFKVEEVEDQVDRLGFHQKFQHQAGWRPQQACSVQLPPQEAGPAHAREDDDEVTLLGDADHAINEQFLEEEVTLLGDFDCQGGVGETADPFQSTMASFLSKTSACGCGGTVTKNTFLHIDTSASTFQDSRAQKRSKSLPPSFFSAKHEWSASLAYDAADILKPASNPHDAVDSGASTCEFSKHHCIEAAVEKDNSRTISGSALARSDSISGSSSTYQTSWAVKQDSWESWPRTQGLKWRRHRSDWYLHTYESSWHWTRRGNRWNKRSYSGADRWSHGGNSSSW